MQTDSLKAEPDLACIQILIFVIYTMGKLARESKKPDQNLTFCSGGGTRTHKPWGQQCLRLPCIPIPARRLIFLLTRVKTTWLSDYVLDIRLNQRKSQCLNIRQTRIN